MYRIIVKRGYSKKLGTPSSSALRAEDKLRRKSSELRTQYDTLSTGL